MAPENSSQKPRRMRYGALSALAVVLVLALVAGAGAAVTVYNNDFSSKSEFAEIERSGGGKRCVRNWRKKSKTMRATLKNGPGSCGYRVPVEGDRELPDHDARVTGKILAKTPKSVRGGAFLELNLRVGGGKVGYFLRVFPEKKKFELTRGPSGGGFPARGKSNAIKKGAQNTLRLVAHGARVQAFANGKELAKITDNDPGRVTGRKIRFAVGNQKDAKKDTVATFRSVHVSVP